jgi:hypothetical protein
MIPFASQRGNGRDLATHLMNAYDNDLVEVGSVRGAIARDLHGAFKEWEVQAAALTKCREYLYSLSINPDPAQAPLTRDQYKDYIARAERALGLTGQPRVTVFHSKFGREHCHVVWSRIDAKKEKAVHLAFDKQTLMDVTRGFARDHGLTLPAGYDKSRGVGQRSLKEQATLLKTGLTVEDRMEQITDAWRHADDNKSFVHALAERGFILAAGRRGYCVVDLYGNTNALSRMIDDRKVQKADVEAFMAKEFPLDGLPSVDEAERLVGDHRMAMEREEKADNLRERHLDRLAELKEGQSVRRGDVEKAADDLKFRHAQEQKAQETAQRRTRDLLRVRYLESVRTTRLARSRDRPKGLAAFLGKISGVTFIRDRIDRRHDNQRLQAFIEQKRQMKTVQRQERQALVVIHRLQTKEIDRQIKALDSIDKREVSALARDEQRDRYVLDRGPTGAIPSLVNLTRRGREQGLYGPDIRADFESAAQPGASSLPDIEGDFARASAGGTDLRDNNGDGDLLHGSRPPRSPYGRRGRSKTRDPDRER